MQNVLVVIDMQNDFISGSLGSNQALSVVPLVKKKIEQFDGTVLFTRDTHFDNYLSTQEGINLPVMHCIEGTEGWQIIHEIDVLRKTDVIDKTSFLSKKLGEKLVELDKADKIESLTFVGLYTDICVIANAFIAKAFLPETPVFIDAKCCAGTTRESHENALKAMEVCQMKILR